MTDFRTVGDLAQQLISRRQNAEARSEMTTLLQETASGRRADIAGSLRGDFTLLAGIEADLSRLDSFSTAIAALQGRGQAMQSALNSGRSLASDMASQLLTVAPPANTEAVRIVAAEARGRFEDFAARLNGSYGGATVFSGVSTNGAAVAAGEDILAALAVEIAPLTNAVDVEAAIRSWFGTGGDYETVGYVGSTDVISGLQVSTTRQISIDVTAADPAIRETLIGLAMASFADSPTLSSQLSDQGALMISAAEQLLGAQDGLARLQGQIGVQQQELVRIETRNAAERTALEIGRGELTDVDVFESASRLEAVQSQIELLYTITARSSQFSLVRFLQ